MVFVLFIVNFIVILTAVKICSGLFHRMMGASAYLFDAKKRFIICAVLALVLALFGI